ncbi:siderophore-interacting protein [Rhodobacteraceae bacterium F11138]|nr:siderophore-interacting protein [Rhodobacteraceae bacterium F11138]
MTIAAKFPHTTETRLPGVEYAAFSKILQHRANSSPAIEMVESSETHLLMRARSGLVHFSDHREGLQINLFADRPERLQTLRDGLIDILANAMPDITETLRWNDLNDTETLPPNLYFATVQSVHPLGSAFLRVRIKADDLGGFQDDAIHFRLVLPPAGLRDIQWPSVKANGATAWPQGDKALHRPVYTTRWVDHDAGLMDFDVFLHDGGRVTQWAGSVSTGDTVAFMGPGGGGIPRTEQILAFADETAFPAIARIAEALPANASGKILMMAADAAGCGYPISVPDGVELTWMAQPDAAALAKLALSTHAEMPDHYFWFAAEKAAAQQVRHGYKQRGGKPQNAYIAGYWTRD